MKYWCKSLWNLPLLMFMFLLKYCGMLCGKERHQIPGKKCRTPYETLTLRTHDCFSNFYSRSMPIRFLRFDRLLSPFIITNSNYWRKDCQRPVAVALWNRSNVPTIWLSIWLLSTFSQEQITKISPRVPSGLILQD